MIRDYIFLKDVIFLEVFYTRNGVYSKLLNNYMNVKEMQNHDYSRVV